MNSRTNIDPVKTKAKRIKCEKEHLFFTRAFFLPRMGFKFSVNWHHEYIADKIDEVIAGKVKNLVINVPPGRGFIHSQAASSGCGITDLVVIQ